MDRIADMITHIVNAGNAGRDSALVGYSKLKADIAEVLKAEGYIKGYEKKIKDGKPFLALDLFVENRVPKVKGVKRMSKPSKRMYKKSSELRPVRQGYGMLVLTTPKGVMSGKQAKREKLGGEVLFSIW
ncbi:30S ribosomal protein S8 [Candidatus Parcubacteria bacterium]|nr:30S ribosomal protein S8 [Candidatus Parcubacteria bacterium]